ncbi:centromere protein I isoform X2 [Cherax quadricarinatus]|uniref:centromere protein I isoform X2 n=1 Tax=Cherax quadricarinatus TaxID=27406 RepID=UPI00387EA802
MSSSVEEAVEFLVRNANHRPRDIDKVEMKRFVQVLQTASVNGLNSRQIMTLSTNVVFTNAYDVLTRRKLLYSLIPEGHDFPYRLIPLAISSATVIPVSPAWQHAILSWLGALLEYGILSPHHKYVHICYPAVFALLSHLNLCGLACKVLYYITLREDVSQSRAQHLMRMKKTKPGFFINISQLLRIYHLFRPDLVVGELSHRRVVPSTPHPMKVALLAARLRLQENSESDILQESNNVWPDRNQVEKVNPYQRKTAIPQPDTNFYTSKVEEKKEKVIFVTQYRRFTELVRGMEDYYFWQWPNNPATHLSKPIIIPLFRPHQQHIFVGLTNWLEFALRSEVIGGVGNPSSERCEKLLNAAYNLVCCMGGRSVPVIDNFITELIMKWDEKTHFDKVIALLGAVSFSSPEFLSESVLKLVAKVLCFAPLITWCKVVEAVTNTVCSWALAAHEEVSNDKNDQVWPQRLTCEASIVGIWFLTLRMERIFLKSLIDFKCHPLAIHYILDYYIKLNMHTEVLKLPVVFLPPAAMTLTILTKGDLMTTHRLGRLISSMRTAMQRLMNMETKGPEAAIQEECKTKAENINACVILFISGVYNAKALRTKWVRMLGPLYPFHLQSALKRVNTCSYAAVTDALAYLPFFTKYLVDTEEAWSAKEKEEVRDKVLAELQEAGLTGIKECVNVYTKG